MNTDNASGCCSRAMWNWAGVIGAFVVMAVIVAALKFYTSATPVNAARAAERLKISAEVRQKSQLELETTAWIDAEKKQFVRLPNAVAVSLSTRLWENPAKARTELLERAAKAFYVPPPPPPAPEKKSDFE